MDPKDFNKKKRPEAKIQKEVIAYLEERGWFVKVTHGNAYQSGLTDLIVCHKVYKIRFIDIKVAGSYKLTKAQLRDWPKFCKNGAGVWIMVAATDFEYKKLFKEPNWAMYLL